MKHIACILFFAAALCGQPHVTLEGRAWHVPSDGSISIVRLPDAASTELTPSSRYMAVWESLEMCYECGSVLAVHCTTPGCATPTKMVQRAAYFDSLKDLKAWLKDRKVDAVYRIKPMKIAVTETEVEVPQPPKKETKVKTEIVD